MGNGEENEEHQQQQGNDDFGAFDDFGDDNGMFPEGEDAFGNGGGGGGGGFSSLQESDGMSRANKPSNNVPETNETELIEKLKQGGMTADNSVDFYAVCFGKGANVVGEDMEEDEEGEEEKGGEVMSLPSRSVAASYFFSLLLAANGCKVKPQQDNAWGRIRVTACVEV